MAFEIGNRVRSALTLPHVEGEVRSVFTGKDGRGRVIVEDDYGWFHIFREDQVRSRMCTECDQELEPDDEYTMHSYCAAANESARLAFESREED